MTMENVSPSPARRNILGHVAGATAAIASLSAAVPKTAEARTDALLLAMCAEAMRLDSESSRLLDDPNAGNPPNWIVSNDMMETWLGLRISIAKMPAFTMAGLRAKAEIGHGLIEMGSDGRPCADNAVAFSVFCDLRSGRAFA